MKNLYILFLITLSIHLLGNENKNINDPNVTIKILESKISDLETQYKEIQDEQKEHFKNQYDVIEKVEGFYDRSWNKLIFLISGLGAIVGIGIPYYMNRKQSKKFEEYNQKLQEQDERLKKELEQYLENKKSEIKEELYDFFNEQYEKIKGEISSEVIGIAKNIQKEFRFHSMIIYDTRYKMRLEEEEYELAINNMIECLRISLEVEGLENNNILELIKEIEIVIQKIQDPKYNLRKDLLGIDYMIKILKSVIDRYPDEYGEQIQKIIDFVKSI